MTTGERIGAGIGGVSAVVRLIDVSFKITGISEEHKEIQKITTAANTAVQTLLILYMTWKLIAASMGPMGWVMLGATALSQGMTIASQFSDTEEVISRGK